MIAEGVVDGAARIDSGPIGHQDEETDRNLKGSVEHEPREFGVVLEGEVVGQAGDGAVVAADVLDQDGMGEL